VCSPTGWLGGEPAPWVRLPRHPLRVCFYNGRPSITLFWWKFHQPSIRCLIMGWYQGGGGIYDQEVGWGGVGGAVSAWSVEDEKNKECTPGMVA
jgi:hypothetical protein